MHHTQELESRARRAIESWAVQQNRIRTEGGEPTLSDAEMTKDAIAHYEGELDRANLRVETCKLVIGILKEEGIIDG